jgi:hypothetical protein
VTSLDGDQDPVREEELAAFADGTLDAARRTAVEAALAESAALAERLAEQERALAAVTRALEATSAPLALRTRVEQAQAARRRQRRRRSVPWLAGLSIAAAAAIVGVLALLPGSSGPSLASAAEATTRAALAGPPAPAAAKLLDLSVEGVPFPDWRAKFGWTATGTRTDRVGGRDVTTVFYEKGGKRIGYGIVAGKGLHVPGGGTTANAEGTTVHLFTVDGRRVATWERRGRTCILTASGVPDATLVKLAAWHGVGAVPF